MVKRFEGVRRIVQVLSVLSTIGWISWVAFQSDGFSQLQPIGWLILFVGVPIAYFIPLLLCKIVYWIIDGFKKDRET